MKRNLALALLALCAGTVFAKLPPPSEEAKAKAAEAAAKTAHATKVGDYQLCKAMNRTAAFYQADAKKQGKEVKPPTATPDCADPGAFVYTPPEAKPAETKPAESKPLEAAGAHSPPATAVTPPSTNTPAAAIAPAKKP